MGTHIQSTSKRFCVTLLGLLVLSLVTAGLAGPTSRARAHGKDKKLVGYFIQWGIYGRNYIPKHVATSGSAGKLTHINYAFGNVAPSSPVPGSPITCQSGDPWADYQKTWTAEESVDGVPVVWGEPLRGNFQQLKQLKALYPNLKMMISLGGWTWSAHFSNAALTRESREAFVKSCVDLFIKGDLPRDADAGGPGSGAGVFDGIDIDWEYPAVCGNTCGPEVARPEDTKNFTLLLKEFRRQLDKVGKENRRHYLLTIAASASPGTFAKLELNKIHKELDFINVMTYDFHGPWETTANFHSALFPSKDDPARSLRLTTHETVQGYIDARVPRDKIVVGVPFFGHGWQGVPDINHGLYQTGTGSAPGTWEAGSDDYKALKAKLAAGGFTRYFNNKTKNAWIYDPANQIFWTYDDPQSLKAKAGYVEDQRLGGVMFWELSGDTPDGELVTVLSKGLD
ncbi:MAG TPA: glycoside hydrolase family 18 protein [Roseiflexaceae bacterium]|nr:glycoside hydrolase family 18 protein [Roseiflexaceae bacterium]